VNGWGVIHLLVSALVIIITIAVGFTLVATNQATGASNGWVTALIAIGMWGVLAAAGHEG
jgi:hypothetical protein